MYEDQNTRCTARTWRAHFVISSSIHDILKNQIQFTPKKHFQIHNYPFTFSFPIFNIDIAMIINNRCCEVGFIDWRSYCRYWGQMWWIVNILDVCISLSKNTLNRFEYTYDNFFFVWIYSQITTWLLSFFTRKALCLGPYNFAKGIDLMNKCSSE